MGDRIVALIDAYNARRGLTGRRKLSAQSLSLHASDGKFPDVVRELLRRERSGETDAGIKPERLLRIAKFFGVSPTFLQTGQNDFDDMPSNVTASPFGPGVGAGQPVISVTGGLGGGGVAEERTVTIGGVQYRTDDVRGEVILPDFMLSSLSNSARRDAVHWFDVAGDSMEPTLHSGDWIAVNVKDKRINGGIFALRDQLGTIIVKRLEMERPGQIAIISDNPRGHAPKTEASDDLTIIGRVIARITRVG